MRLLVRLEGLAHSTDKYRRVIYQCNHKYKGGKPCSTPHVTEDQVKDAFVRAVNILLSEKEELSVNVQMVIAMLCDSAELEKRQTELKEELEVVVGLVERCVTENARVALDQDEYTQRYNGLVSRYEAVKAQFDEVTQAVADKADRKSCWSSSSTQLRVKRQSRSLMNGCGRVWWIS